MRPLHLDPRNRTDESSRFQVLGRPLRPFPEARNRNKGVSKTGRGNARMTSLTIRNHCARYYYAVVIRVISSLIAHEIYTLKVKREPAGKHTYQFDITRSKILRIPRVSSRHIPRAAAIISLYPPPPSPAGNELSKYIYIYIFAGPQRLHNKPRA